MALSRPGSPSVSGEPPSDALAASGATVVITGESAPAAMPLREDLRTRLGWGLVFGLIPLAATARGWAAAVLGVVPILYVSLVVPKDFAWQEPVGAVGTILVGAGLLLRSAYRDASLGRLLATIGAADFGVDRLPVGTTFVIASHDPAVIASTDWFI